MAEAVVALTRNQLADVLANWPGQTADTSWAMGFVSAAPTAAELGALKEAAKLCDRVVAVRLAPGTVPPPGIAAIVREAGADVLFMPKEATGRLRVGIEGDKEGFNPVLGLMVEAILAVLPGLVVVPRGAVVLIGALRAVQGSWGELFTLRVNNS